ncbi:class I SAM-dependent DNA methyltransferase [Corynebacterium sp. UMB2355A]|uniref:class I SAM-dependent DNA methyltransferase n=1 Tax=Corynebacterium sp. UMB2355A TaxID=3081222 RepID=UPI0029FEC891|nr:DNA methyltransferase [Corynebacterium sp. UMB2355A]WPJ93873.1 DNA methyltransferase [Corynebacterium sp. UMB2355A]
MEVGDDAPVCPEDEDRDTFEVSVFLSRILFLLFAEDSELIPRGLFTTFVEEHTTAETLGGQMQALFETLNTPCESRDKNLPDYLAMFPYVNGRLFEQHVPTRYFSAEMREALLAATVLDWSGISPAIFGSLFQMVKSKEARRADGEHYTSEANILKVIGPLFLDEFRREADRLIRNKSTTVKKFRAFQDELATYQFLDPACGSGNFLVVAYRELRLIETDIIAEIYRRDHQSMWSLNVEFDQKVRIDQFHGIEKNWWPALIAEVAMFLVDHQANVELSKRIGLAPERLPLRTAANIRHADALKVDWGGEEGVPDAAMTFVFGNPPFLGNNYQTDEQRADVKRLWGELGVKSVGQPDLVTGWHVKSVQFLADRHGKFGFVTTNSIAQGSHVPLVFGTLRQHGWVPEFVHQSFPWDAEAAVHCVVVGFTRERGVKQRLWAYGEKGVPPVEVAVKQFLNAYLVDGPDVVVEKRTMPLSPVVPPASRGSQPTSGNNLDPKPGAPKPVDDAVAMKYVRRLVGAHELIHDEDRWCLWLEDLDPKDLAKSPVLQERVEGTRQFRLQSKKAATRDDATIPHLFTERRQPESDYLCIPVVFSENRPYFTADYLPAEVIANNRVFTAEDSDGFAFAIISSSMFKNWQDTIGGRLESRNSFANTLVWNTFPMPDVDEKTRQRIIIAGQKILEARKLRPDLSLDEQYKVMSPELIKAHNALDAEMDKAFGAKKRLDSKQERLSRLFDSYKGLSRD